MQLDFKKGNGLVPAIIQDDRNEEVLMMGYMNDEALKKTMDEKRVTFYSRSRKELWTKGETSGNYLKVKSINSDCDYDTLLIRVVPTGPVCHTGETTCFGEGSSKGFLYELESTIHDRKQNPLEKSYTSKLFRKGINKITQKVGEEAVELIIEAKDNNQDLFKDEAADLLYHFLVLLTEKGVKLEEVEDVLAKRRKK